MEMIPPGQSGLALRGKFKFPNVMVFPRELRDAISPEHNSRALVFDSCSGAKAVSPIPVQGMIGEKQFNFGRRARVDFVVHETGKLDGKFIITADLDSATTRALGQFLIDLADQTEK